MREEIEGTEVCLQAWGQVIGAGEGQLREEWAEWNQDCRWELSKLKPSPVPGRYLSHSASQPAVKWLSKDGREEAAASWGTAEYRAYRWQVAKKPREQAKWESLG